MKIPRWLLIMACVLPLTLVWALANPMFGMNDEPAHMIRAQGAVRGDFSDPYPTDGLPGEQYNCVFWQGQTADCMNLTWGADSSMQSSPTNNYPPLFHLISGVPSLFVSGLAGAYFMRVWLVIVCSAVLTWAITLLLDRSPDRATLLGVSVGCTPMFIFCMSGVAPSGLTAVAATLLWSSGLNYLSPTSTTKFIRSRNTFFAVAVLFPFLRRDAFLWEGLIIACLLVMASRQTLIDLFRRRSTQILSIILVATVGVVWLTWAADATSSFADNAASHFGGSWSSGLGQMYTYILMLVGCFGWNSTWMSSETLVLVLGTATTVLLLAIAGAGRSLLRGLLLTVAFFFIVPITIGAVRAYYVQGRYLFPLWVGMFVLAGQALAGSRLDEGFRRRLFRIVISLQLVYQFFAFAQNQRRYVVGQRGTWRFLSLDNVWHPPMMSNKVTAVIFVFALSLIPLAGTLLMRNLDASTQPIERPST